MVFTVRFDSLGASLFGRLVTKVRGIRRLNGDERLFMGVSARVVLP